jgi:hypothetical protein
MSNQQSHFQSKTFSSSTFTSSSNDQPPQTWRTTKSTESGPQGTTVHHSSQEPNQSLAQETLHFDNQGKLVPGRTVNSGMIEDTADADQQYLERMEDEYAKREGGA